MPRVSVVIPTHNRPHLISRSIKSVLAQTYNDFEIIIVDDGIEKRSQEIIDGFGDQRIRYIQNEKSVGGAVSRNIGIKESRGEFIAFLDDDDEWLPEKLAKQVKAFDSCDDSVVLVFCGLSKYNKRGELLEVKVSDENGVVWPFKKTLYRGYIWTSTIMLRKKNTEQGIIFDETLKKNQEWDLQLRLLKVGKFYAIKESLVKLNILDEDEHMGGMQNIDTITSYFKIFINKHYVDYKKNKKALAFCYLRLANLYKKNNQFTEARKYLFKSWLVTPWNLFYFYYAMKLSVKMLVR